MSTAFFGKTNDDISCNFSYVSVLLNVIFSKIIPPHAHNIGESFNVFCWTSIFMRLPFILIKFTTKFYFYSNLKISASQVPL